jgi:hypothetical protein
VEPRLHIDFCAESSRELRCEKQLATNQNSRTNWRRRRIEEELEMKKRSMGWRHAFFWREQCFDESVAGFNESDRIRAFRNEMRVAQLKLGTRFGTG